jgi:hypothetical protein
LILGTPRRRTPWRARKRDVIQTIAAQLPANIEILIRGGAGDREEENHKPPIAAQTG